MTNTTNITPATTRPYNILSIDGGGIRNLITLKGLEFMETYACEYSKNPKNKISGINCTEEGVIQIKDIFDMVAGSTMGGIVAAALVCPANE
jgi:patatin-like phospholipase/acyl hydrolase